MTARAARRRDCSCVTRNEECEEHFLQKVKKWARLNGWLVYHTRDSRGSDPGFPDLVLLSTNEYGAVNIIFAELKTESGALSDPQADWYGLLIRAGGPVYAHIWRPSDWPEIEATLCRPAREEAGE